MRTFEIVEVDEAEELAKYLDAIECHLDAILIRKMASELAALKEENERRLRELSDAGSKIVDLGAGKEVLKARVAELEKRS